jgi:hypothetical protein
MNEHSYINRIVTSKNLFWEGGEISVLWLQKFNVDPKEWNMKQIKFPSWNGYLASYKIGYCLYEIDNLYYLRYDQSNIPWVNREWLPYWGKTTILKSNMLKEFNNKVISIKRKYLESIGFCDEIINLVFNNNKKN